MNGPQACRSAWIARALVIAAAQLLPACQRQRYRLEWLAELERYEREGVCPVSPALRILRDAPVVRHTLGRSDEAVPQRESAQEIYERFIKIKEAQWRHQRRLAWADLLAQVIGLMSVLAVLAYLAVTSLYAIKRGDSIQGSPIIYAGATSIAVFVMRRTSRIIRRHSVSKGKDGGAN